MPANNDDRKLILKSLDKCIKTFYDKDLKSSGSEDK